MMLQNTPVQSFELAHQAGKLSLKLTWQNLVNPSQDLTEFPAKSTGLFYEKGRLFCPK
ncbi:hypothetical protein [Aquipseudomonas alcaligenes]|uniref:hypothetical protein n=1 Tax=Aquipseudomonas alcaligenes TaxID=43263 RepID=UPI0015E8AFB7|nr:hypothetical protein [Pseudomonas alcaligenes]